MTPTALQHIIQLQAALTDAAKLLQAENAADALGGRSITLIVRQPQLLGRALPAIDLTTSRALADAIGAWIRNDNEFREANVVWELFHDVAIDTIDSSVTTLVPAFADHDSELSEYLTPIFLADAGRITKKQHVR